jgi:hypothetical protein
MNAAIPRRQARELLKGVQDGILVSFPSDAVYYRGFFKRFGPQLLQAVIAALDPLMTKAAERLDAVAEQSVAYAQCGESIELACRRQTQIRFSGSCLEDSCTSGPI